VEIWVGARERFAGCGDDKGILREEGRREMSKIVVGVAVVRDGKLLMVQENKEKCRGQWNFPAGHLDAGETLFEAAKREAKEETGYDIELTGLVAIISRGESHPQLIFFSGDVVGGDIEYDLEEIMDVKWIPFEDLGSMNIRVPEEDFAFIMSRAKNSKIYPLDIVKEKK
jgi:8-oxo-dGTP pyrophosphatase MutT (NUDIX family)